MQIFLKSDARMVKAKIILIKLSVTHLVFIILVDVCCNSAYIQVVNMVLHNDKVDEVIVKVQAVLTNIPSCIPDELTIIT